MYKNTASLSMYPTIGVGMSVCVSSDLKFEKLSRFDLILMKSPSSQFKELKLVRRVLAFGGEKLSVNQNGITVDGQKIEMPQVLIDALSSDVPEHSKNSIYRNYEIPEGTVFVVGDNIFKAIDSTEFGSIDENFYLGKVMGL